MGAINGIGVFINENLFEEGGLFERGRLLERGSYIESLRVSSNENMTVIRGFQWGLPSSVKWSKN